MSAHPRSDLFCRDILLEFPRFRVVDKAGVWHQTLIDRLLRLITFGGQRSYLSRYHTVLGDTLYVPASWPAMRDDDRYVLLRHERVHLRQRRRYGTIGMALLYLLPIAPLGLAYGRARIEWEAYVETLRATAETFGLEAARDPVLHDALVARFVGPEYGWMWPFPGTIRRWIAEALADIAGESHR